MHTKYIIRNTETPFRHLNDARKNIAIPSKLLIHWFL